LDGLYLVKMIKIPLQKLKGYSSWEHHPSEEDLKNIERIAEFFYNKTESLDMTQEMRTLLISKGRKDLVDIYDITQEGFAGVNQDGQIVDRRTNPSAIPIPENKLLGVPKPKTLDATKR